MLRFPGGPLGLFFHNCFFRVHRQGTGRFYSPFAVGWHAQNISATVHLRRINLIPCDDLFITSLGQSSPRAEQVGSVTPQNMHSADTLSSAGCSHWAAELDLQSQCWAEGGSFPVHPWLCSQHWRQSKTFHSRDLQCPWPVAAALPELL